jgi:hypothetical protein
MTKSSLSLIAATALFIAAGVFSGASAQTPNVTSSVLATIVIQPNDRPTIVDIASDQQFLAAGYTNDGQALLGLTFTWSTEGGVGSITREGMFTGEQGGIGKVTARSGSVTASVGVVVRGVAKTPEKPEKKATVNPPFSTVVQHTNQQEEANATENEPDTGEVKGATTDEQEGAQGSQQCSTVRAWVWALVLLFFSIVLFAYFLSLGESRTFFWWVWPALCTAATYVVFFLTRCGSLHSWMPWVLGACAVFLSFFYLRVLRPAEHTSVQPPRE